MTPNLRNTGRHWAHICGFHLDGLASAQPEHAGLCPTRTCWLLPNQNLLASVWSDRWHVLGRSVGLGWDVSGFGGEYPKKDLAQDSVLNPLPLNVENGILLAWMTSRVQCQRFDMKQEFTNPSLTSQFKWSCCTQWSHSQPQDRSGKLCQCIQTPRFPHSDLGGARLLKARDAALQQNTHPTKKGSRSEAILSSSRKSRAFLKQLWELHPYLSHKKPDSRSNSRSYSRKWWKATISGQILGASLGFEIEVSPPNQKVSPSLWALTPWRPFLWFSTPPLALHLRTGGTLIMSKSPAK